MRKSRETKSFPRTFEKALLSLPAKARFPIYSLSFICLVSGWSASGQNEGLKFKIMGFFKNRSACEKSYKETFRPNFSVKKKRKLSRGAKACVQEKKIKKALFILEKLLKEEEDPLSPSAKKWKKELAEWSFYKMKDYEKALKHWTDLLSEPLEPNERFFIQYHVAESFFYLKKYSQALREVDKCFFDGISTEEKKRALILKARALMSGGQSLLALELFESQIQQFPEEESFLREYLAFIHETRKDFSSAIKELEKIRPSNPFIRQKIHRLMERHSQQPGF